MQESVKKYVDRWGWAVVSYLGCILLLLGNTLPWPCLGVNARDCSVLITFHLNDSWYGILLVIALLLIPLEVKWLKSPANYVCWLSFWLIAYLLVGPKLYPVTIDAEVWGYLPFVTINHDLAGPSYWVMPLSLVAFWLAIRPKNLQGIWRIGSIISLLALIAVTVVFFIPMDQRVNQFTRSSSPYADRALFGTGPVLILIGAVLLLGSAFTEMRRGWKKAAVEDAAEA